VTWGGVGGATSYTLQEQANGASWASVYTGAGKSWSASGHAASAYGYRVRACNSSGCSGWSSVKATTVSIPLALNGKSYTAGNLIRNGSGKGGIGIQIINGTTWQIFNLYPRIGTGIIASGTIPAAAKTVKYTWTYVGVPSGHLDGAGSVTNGYASPAAVTPNPWSGYSTVQISATDAPFGRTYSVRVDFYNATGVNISSSTCSMTAEAEGML
jgi:hypothetical protein